MVGKHDDDAAWEPLDDVLERNTGGEEIYLHSLLGIVGSSFYVQGFLFACLQGLNFAYVLARIYLGPKITI